MNEAILLSTILLSNLFAEVHGQESLQPLLKAYCIECHGAENPKGNVRLDDVSKIGPPLWKNIYEQLAGEEMPPEDSAQPKPDDRRRLMDHALNEATKETRFSAPGFRRLNHREYSNTVRDLLGLRNGTFDPGMYIYRDEVTDGFDTEAKALVISNELLLEYLNSAEKSLNQALFTGSITQPPAETVNVPMKSMDGVGGNRYIIPAKDHVLMRNGGKGMIYASKATRAIDTPGRYKITVTAAGVDRDNYPIRLTPEKGPIVLGFGIAGGGQNQIKETVPLQDDIDQTFTFETWIDKGFFPYFTFENGPPKPVVQIRAGIRRGNLPKKAMSKPYEGPAVRVSAFKIEGPFFDEWPTESIRTTFDSATIPNLANTTAREWTVGRFATRAFRRPVTKEELAPYFRYLNKQYAETKNWNESIIRTFAAIMGSVDFLYLREEGDELGPHALASRLSYFFWSTMPDAELFALAKSGKLKEPSILKAQITRMIDDPRSDRFCDSFSDQWLALNTLGSMPPDAKSSDYRIYYRANLESAMLEETHRYFRHVLRDNRSVREFIDSDYSFVNSELAELYNVPFSGRKDEFVRVKFPLNAHRGGLLGHASILTLSANGVETSPVVRGVWVLKNFLGTPPPPPPDEVPALVPDLNGAQTVRQLLARHRNDKACMDCHRQIDPPGFALEAYDPIGRFRTAYSKRMPVSTEGEYKGKPFRDITGLKKLMLTQQRSFARSLIVRIAEYAKGRKLEAADFKIVEQLTLQSAKSDFRFNDMIRLIAESKLLTMR